MPYYKYICEECGNNVTIYISITNKDRRDEQICQRCENKLERVILDKSIYIKGDSDAGEEETDRSEDDYITVKKRINKEIAIKKRELEDYKEDTKRHMEKLEREIK
jgi:putative FmdB family regulatory protein